MSLTPVRVAVNRDAIEGRLGFTPEESVVLAAASTDHDGLVARVNLTDLLDEHNRSVLLARLATPLRETGTTGVAIFYYTTTSPCALKPVDRAIDEFLTDLGVPRLTTRLIDTPAAGTRREDLAVITPDTPDRRQHAHQAIRDGQPDDGLWVYLAALAFARHGVPIPPALLGKAATWLHTCKANRDAVVVLITGGSYHDAHALTRSNGPDADRAAGNAIDAIMEPDRATTPGLEVLDHARLLTQMIAVVPRDYQVAPRTLLGLIAYWAGDGALADRHCAEALTIDRTAILASQIRALQALGIPPGWVQRATQ